MPPSARILLVDDNEELRETLADLFEELDFDVLEAATAEDGWRLFDEARGTISVVVTDVMLPGQSGLWLLDRIRADGHRPARVVISGRVDHDGLRERLERAEFAFLPKPFTLETLLSTVDAARAEAGSERR